MMKWLLKSWRLSQLPGHYPVLKIDTLGNIEQFTAVDDASVSGLSLNEVAHLQRRLYGMPDLRLRTAMTEIQEEKTRQRQQLAQPVLDDLKAWLEKNSTRVPRDSPVSYTHLTLPTTVSV